MVFETVQPFYACCPIAFQAFEIFSVIVFSIECLLRLWSCTASGQYAHPVRGRLRFAFSFLGLVDLLKKVTWLPTRNAIRLTLKDLYKQQGEEKKLIKLMKEMVLENDPNNKETNMPYPKHMFFRPVPPARD